MMGLLEKSSIKVVRWDFETLKQAENEKVEARMHSAPTGKRHDAYYVYLNSIRLKELDRGHTVSWVSLPSWFAYPLPSVNTRSG